MTLTSEMTRLATEFETAQATRLAAVEGIQMAVRRDLAAGRAALQRTMADHAKTLDADLKGIFSQTALIRGKAEDLIDQFAAQGEANAEELRAKLEDYVADLQSSVNKLLNEYTRAREAMGAREAAARTAYLKDLRSRVEAVLSNAANFLDGLNKGRERAGRIWRQHAFKMHRQRRAAVKPPAAASASKGKAQKTEDAPGGGNLGAAPALKGKAQETEDAPGGGNLGAASASREKAQKTKD